MNSLQGCPAIQIFFRNITVNSILNLLACQPEGQTGYNLEIYLDHTDGNFSPTQENSLSLYLRGYRDKLHRVRHCMRQLQEFSTNTALHCDVMVSS